MIYYKLYDTTSHRYIDSKYYHIVGGEVFFNDEGVMYSQKGKVVILKGFKVTSRNLKVLYEGDKVEVTIYDNSGVTHNKPMTIIGEIFWDNLNLKFVVRSKDRDYDIKRTTNANKIGDLES